MGLSWGLYVEAIRKGRYVGLPVRQLKHGPEGRLSECAARMIVASGIAPTTMDFSPGTKWWWAEGARGPCPFPANATNAIPEPAPQHWSDECPPGMTAVPAGTFTAGEGSQAVAVQAFCFDVREVSSEEYEACARAGRCSIEHTGERSADGVHFVCESQCSNAGEDPMTCVDWSQASSYCAAQGKRLPSKEEWEWAARGTPAARLLEADGGDLLTPTVYPGLQPLAPASWEWTSSSAGPGRRILSNGLDDPYGPDFALTGSLRTTSAARDQGLRAEFLGFRCVR